MKSLNRQKTSIPTLSENSIEASTNLKRLKYSTLFHKCFNHSMSPLHFADLDDLDPVDKHLHTEDILRTVAEVEQHLRTLNVSKANGPDGISARMLKETAISILHHQ